MKWALVTQPESMKRASEGTRHRRPSLYGPNGCLSSLPQPWRARGEKGVEWWRALSALATQQPLFAMKAQVMSPVQPDKISKNTNLVVCVCVCVIGCHSCSESIDCGLKEVAAGSSSVVAIFNVAC